MVDADIGRSDSSCGRGLGPRVLGGLRAVTGSAFILLVRGYQVGLRPLMLGSCKFCPSCSEYFIQAVHKHGPARGGWLGMRRLLRCHPFGAGGYDPVP